MEAESRDSDASLRSLQEAVYKGPTVEVPNAAIAPGPRWPKSAVQAQLHASSGTT